MSNKVMINMTTMYFMRITSLLRETTRKEKGR